MTNPTVHPHEARVAVESACALGEGALWDDRTGTLLWVDIEGRAIWRHQPETGLRERLEVPERVGFVALTEDHDIVVAGFKSGLARVHLFGGQTQPIVAPEPDKPDNRINDGVVGPDGSLYFGTMHGEGAEATGAFYRYDGGSLSRFHGDMPVTNGPAVSPDGQTLYTVDTRARFIFAHVLTDGVPGEAQRFARFEEGWGNPDGLAVDAQGHLWVCHWGGSRITRFAPDGSVERVVPIPTAQVTKCAFGGPDMTTLFVTTAARGRDRASEPHAGHVFAVETDVKGQRSHVYKG